MVGTYRLAAGFEIDAPHHQVWEAMTRLEAWRVAWPVQAPPGAVRLRAFPTDLVEWRLAGGTRGAVVWRLDEVGTTTASQGTAAAAVPVAFLLDGLFTRLAARRHIRMLVRAVRATAAELGVPARKIVCRRLDHGAVRDTVGALALLWLLGRGHARAG